jgi:hypothetical protein
MDGPFAACNSPIRRKQRQNPARNFQKWQIHASDGGHTAMLQRTRQFICKQPRFKRHFLACAGEKKAPIFRALLLY